jgi:hypothetical protein
VPKVYAILGLGALYFFLIFFNIAGEFLVNIAGFIIPGYYSLNALFSASKVDDTQVRGLLQLLRHATSAAGSRFTKHMLISQTVAYGTHPRLFQHALKQLQAAASFW